MNGDIFLPPYSQKQKVYREKYRADKRRREVVFRKDQYREIEIKAKEYKRPVGEFIKDCLFAYFDNRYIVKDEDLYRCILMEIKRIGNNINQIARKVNRNNSVSFIDTTKVSKEIKEMEVMIKNSLEKPPELLDTIQKAIQDPYTMYKIEVLIYNQKLKSNDCKNKQMENGRVQKTT